MINKNPREFIKLVLKTRPLKCNPQASVEIHSLTSHDYVYMYIAAVKSLLRFYDNIAVFIHDDGTLKAEDEILLKKHITGSRIVNKAEADRKMAHVLANLPNSKKYRATSLIALQLFDYTCLSGTGKYISLDSDTLFLKRPDKLIDWAENGKKEIVCFYEMNPSGQADFLAEIGCNFPAHICAGLFCFHKELIGLNRIEKVLAKKKTFNWFTTQNLLPVLIKDQAKKYKISFFDPVEYQDPHSFSPNAVFRHYWSSLGLVDTYLTDFIGVISSLNKKTIDRPPLNLKKLSKI